LKKQKASPRTQTLINLDRFDKYNGFHTLDDNHIVYMIIQPVKVSILGKNDLLGKINDLQNVLETIGGCEIIVLSAVQSFESNKQNLRRCMENASNAAILTLCQKDIEEFDNLSSSNSTNREFIFSFSFPKNTDRDTLSVRLSEYSSIIYNNGFNARLATKDDIKRTLGLYYSQDIYTVDFPDFDGAQYLAKAKKPLSDEEIEQLKLKSYVDLIAPSSIGFKKHSDYYTIGNTYRSVWAIRSYPTKIEKRIENLAILKELGEGDGVTLHIYTEALPQYEKTHIFEAAQRRNRQKTTDYKITTATEAAQNMQDIQDLIVSSFKQKEPFLQCAVFIEIIANSLKDLRSKQSRVGGSLNHQHILVDHLRLHQMEGFNSVKPGGKNMFGSQFLRVLPASSIANLFPLSYSGKTDPQGLFLGKDVNGSYIITDFDRRTEDKTNGHILVLGNSGQGKSYLMKLIITNMRQIGKKIYILDPEDEYRELVRELGGTYIDMMSSKYYINVLEIRKWTDNTDEPTDAEPEAFKKSNRLSQHIAYLRDFFLTYSQFSERELDIIEIMLDETYKRAHITDSSDFDTLSSNSYPILSDLYKVIEDKLSTYDEEVKAAQVIGHPIMYSKDMLQSVGLGLKTICIGSMSSYFNGHTNIPNADFVVFSVKEALNTNKNLKDAMFLNIFSYMSHKFLTEGECLLVADEYHEFVKNEIAVRYTASFMARGRKRESLVAILSTHPEALLAEEVRQYTKPLLMIPTHSFLFNPGENCLPEDYQKVLNIQPYEYRLIDKPKRGRCLYKCGLERFQMLVQAPKYKAELFGSGGGR